MYAVKPPKLKNAGLMALQLSKDLKPESTVFSFKLCFWWGVGTRKSSLLGKAWLSSKQPMKLSADNNWTVLGANIASTGKYQQKKDQQK